MEDKTVITQFADWAARGIEVVGISIIVLGAGFALIVFFRALLRRDWSLNPYEHLRASLGRSILLGLEFLVGADIISTVAVDPTIRSAAVLGLIVLIRTFLSFAIEVEIEGRWPWRGSETSDKAPASR